MLASPVTSTPAAVEEKPESLGNRVLALLLLGCVALVFWPATRWIVTETAARAQIRQAGVLLLVTAAVVAWAHRRDLRLRLSIDNRALLLLGAAQVCVAAAAFGQMSILMLPGFVFALAGCLQVLVGWQSYCFLRPLVTGVAALVIIVLAFPYLDWPLRQLAGLEAAVLLQKLGLAPQLVVYQMPELKLILTIGRHAFEVATECNGFGLITTGALLALLVARIAGRSVAVTGVLVVTALVLGFTFNVLRILSICLLAPKFPNHYHLLHETMGLIALWSGLGVVMWFSWAPVAVATGAPVKK